MGPVEHYLSRVAPLAQGGYISVHLLGTHGGLPGKACSNFKQAIMLVNWFMEKNLDLFLSQGGQERHGPVKQGKTIPEADRTLPNIWCLKSLRMDIDRKLYSSAEKMDVAVEKFYTDTSFPRSPFAIRSGSGGYHLYWPFDRLVHPDEWQPMADALSAAAQSTGLKFDTECTVDRTRVLRIPGTKNYKVKDKPTNVEIWYDTGEVFTVEQLQQPLAQWVKPLTASSDNASEFEDERNMQGGGKVYAPVDIEVVRKECGFVDHTLNTGGTDASYYLWWLSLCLARHTTNPHAVAHALSNKYHSYSQSETTEKFKDAEKQNKGPPFCATIARHGATQCPACKHNNRSSNPISITYGRNGHTYHSTILSDLPDKYYRWSAKANYIYIDIAEEDGGRVYPHCIFPFQIVPNSGRLEGGSPYTLVFKTKEGDDEKEIRVGAGHLTNLSKSGEAFGDQGIPFTYGKQQKDFFMSFIAKLRDSVIKLPPMGWNLRNGEYGFSFDQKFIAPSGEYPALSINAEYQYGVVGSAKPWTDLADILITIQRLDLCCLVAAGFAAPLLGLAGHNGVLIGGWSTATGVGKTTAMSLSQAIWGSPASMNGLSDTFAHLVAKAAMLKSLPLYHDEIKDEVQEAQFIKMANQITEGRDRGRANRDGSLRATKQWEMPIVYAANRSMVSAAERSSKGTSATMVRMLEFRCLANQLTTHSFDDVDRMRTSLKDNYGHIGLVYAAYLGRNRDYVKIVVDKIEKDFVKRLGYEEGDRYWFAGATAVTAGSYFAKLLGLAPFDPASIRDYLIDQIVDLRTHRKLSPSDYSKPAVIVSELSSYLRYNRAAKTIITDIIILDRGKPVKGSVQVENDGPMKFINSWPCVQIARGLKGKPDTPHLRFTDASLREWCKLTNKEYSSLADGIEKLSRIHPSNARIGSGTRFGKDSGTELCWTISIKQTDLEKAIDWEFNEVKDDDETETDASS